MRDGGSFKSEEKWKRNSIYACLSINWRNESVYSKSLKFIKNIWTSNEFIEVCDQPSIYFTEKNLSFEIVHEIP